MHLTPNFDSEIETILYRKLHTMNNFTSGLYSRLALELFQQFMQFLKTVEFSSLEKKLEYFFLPIVDSCNSYQYLYECGCAFFCLDSVRAFRHVANSVATASLLQPRPPC